MYATVADIPQVKVMTTSCSALLRNDSKELQLANSYQEAHMGHGSDLSLSPEELIKQTSNCQTFIKQRQYLMKPVSSEEAEFPIAFSLLLYKEPGQAERLLRAIYRPQNYYCVHVDRKSEAKVFEAMQSLSGCFPNVFLSSRRVDVTWGQYSVLEPEYVCMSDLWKHRKWKYFIDLTGQEFPLKTNLDLVRILKVYNGANDVQGRLYDL